jgi:uncharacterized membrane protein (UPF0127 family)
LIFFNRPPVETLKIDIKGKTYNLEIAKTIPQKMQGLMNRNYLCPDCGMIFISPMDTPQSFWMKNTFIPLDMIFVNLKGEVVNILTAEAEAKDENGAYKFFQSSSPAAYVIELNAGDASKLKLIPGDVIKL